MFNIQIKDDEIFNINVIMWVFYNGYQIFSMLYSLKLQCHICHSMPFLVYMPFSREGTKE